MRKLILFLALILSLAVLPVKAQNVTQTVDHDYKAETCNHTINDGFANRPGYGTNGALRVKFYITPHYKMQDFEGLKKDFASVFVTGLNDMAQNKSYKVRFEAVDYDSTEDFNFLVFIFIDKTSDGKYIAAYDVHGWGEHHLFTYVTSPVVEPSNTVVEGVTNLPTYFQNGWSCR